MPSERIQRRIDLLLDEADQAMSVSDWETVRQRCRAILAFDPDNAEAREYLVAAERGAAGDRAAGAPAAADRATPSLTFGRRRAQRLRGGADT